MTLIETEDDIVAVDCGLMFPDDEMFGIDIVINDFTYLRARAAKFRAVLVTHGHEDHIGGIPYLLREFNVPIVGTGLTLALIRAKMRDHRSLAEATFDLVKRGERRRFGSIEAEFIHITHSVAGACSLAIRTPLGTIFHTGDFKFDQTPLDGEPADFAAIARVGDEGVLALLSDSTNAERPGHTPSERAVSEAFANIFARARGRIIVASFASNVPRIQQLLEQAERHGRRVAFLGRSLQNVVHFAAEQGHLRIPPGMHLRVEEIDLYPPDSIAIMTTGSQGEPMSALTRLSLRDHPKLRIAPGDTVVISATPIPGNEKSVARTINNLCRLGANVVHGSTGRAHVSGHGSQEELLLMLNLVRPDYFMPVHGEYRMLAAHGVLAKRTGVPPANVFTMENGDILEFTQTTADRVGRTLGGNILVAGSGIGDIGEGVLRDRKLLATDGILMVVLTLDKGGKRIAAGPDIVMRGVFYVQDSEKTMKTLRDRLEEIVGAGIESNGLDAGALKEHIRSGLGKIIFSLTKRKPMIIPVIMQV
jgi:ribonuclease J